MSNPATMQKKNGKHLWFALLGMGFQPETAVSSVFKSAVNTKHINLGPNMFDKPNKDASYIVIHFLLDKLNPTRFHDSYRHCWPVLNHKADAEFRKVTCAWLREIMDEIANAGSKVVASLFLSPGGPKFISLMLHLANHVMVQEMKTFTTDDGWFSEAAALPPSSLHMAEKRFSLTSKRFFKTAVDQDRFLQEYNKRAQVLVKSIKDLREQDATYTELLKRYSHNPAQEGACLTEKIEKVRSLWLAIDRMQEGTKEEQNAVACVLKGDVDQYVLDGTDQSLTIPRRLLERIERLPHQLSSGNLYVDGQLNLLCVFELTNHALHILKDERAKVAQASDFQLSPQNLQEKCQQMERALQDLQIIRQKISKEGIPEVQGTIRDTEAEWDRKWMSTLKETPLVSFLNEDPALGFLSPMTPLSFKPAADTNYRSGVFSQYPAKLLEEKPAESKSNVPATPNYFFPESSCSAEPQRPDSPVVATDPLPRANTSLDWIFDTPPSPTLVAPPPPQASVRKVVQPKVTPINKNSRIVEMECENLADRFAEAVTCTSSGGRVKGLELESLLNTLQGDPFSTRKQLPRTPESLIMDVKSSWRKAVEEDRVEKLRRSSLANDSITERPVSSTAPQDASPGPDVCAQGDARSPSACQQGDSLKTTLFMDTFAALDSPSGTGSSAIQFTLDHEMLPEMSSCDSLLSLDDDKEHDRTCKDVLLIPGVKSEAAHRLQTCNLLGNLSKTPERLLLGDTGSDTNWLMEPGKSPSDTVFSLDLDKLKTPSPPKKPEFVLPTLITFSPIDDMKC